MGFLKKMKAKLEDLNGFLRKIKAKFEDFLQLEEEWQAWFILEQNILLITKYNKITVMNLEIKASYNEYKKCNQLSMEHFDISF